MKFKQPFKIEIDKEYGSCPDDEPRSAYGRITINDDYEQFYMSPQVWSIDMYQQQWNLALEKIKTETKSCFIQNIQTNPLVFLWTIYKVPSEKKIYIQNMILINEDYDEEIGKNFLTPKNIFNIIKHERITEVNEPEPEDEEEKLFWNVPPSEWSIEYED